MIWQVPKTQVLFENDDHLTVDASEIGLPPGTWPEAIEYRGVRYVENDDLFGLAYRGDDVICVDYVACGGGRMRVWND